MTPQVRQYFSGSLRQGSASVPRHNHAKTVNLAYQHLLPVVFAR